MKRPSTPFAICRVPPTQEAVPTIEFGIGVCLLGNVLVARSGRGICAILLGDDAAALEAELVRRFPEASIADGGSAMANELAGVYQVIEAPGSGFNMTLAICGTAFQQRVWEALRQIPAGSTRSYSQVANSLGLPGSTRAVAGACAANPIAIVIPCHRVIRADGGLSGYRWGIERKRLLLAREKAASDHLLRGEGMRLAAA